MDSMIFYAWGAHVDFRATTEEIIPINLAEQPLMQNQ